MEFDRVLDKIAVLLAQRGRVSFAALKQYFDLNDEQLTAVKDELIAARGIARNEADQVLVYAGAQPAMAEQPAERRHLTVLFADMVGSTDLAARLDPEEFRDVVRDYQLTAAHAIERYAGYIAQYLGDGLLVYFGYPRAHEDDPRRAVFAATELLHAMATLNLRLQRSHGVSVALRIGVHTGLVVIGDVGGGERHEALALGKTPNMAARLQALAEPDTIVISAQTKDLLGDTFTLKSLGQHRLKGIPDEVAVFQVTATTGLTSKFDSAATAPVLPLAGRRGELARLVRLWSHARRGNGAAVLIRGEAGIGKSRLVQALKEHVAAHNSNWLVLRASPYHANTPLYPVLAFWRQTVGISDELSAGENLAMLEASLADFQIDHERAVGIFARLLNIPLSDAATKESIDPRDMADTVVSMVQQLCQISPRLLIVEDLHWADPSSVDLVRRIVELRHSSALLVTLTARPEFDAQRIGPVEELQLTRLPRDAVDKMISSVAGGRTLDREVSTMIARRTDGVPAFVEELTRMLIESDLLRDEGGHLVPVAQLPETIPATLKDTLMARLDMLGEAKMVAQLAAVIGRSFPLGLLSAAIDMPVERLEEALRRLQSANVLKRRDFRGSTTYIFRHLLLQQAAYESLLKATRRDYHGRIAQLMESQFQAWVENQPERVAEHFTRAGAIEQAIGYWQWAGEAAVERAANVEAIVHLRRGLELLATLDASPLREQRELALLTTLGPAIVVTRGWAAPELGQIYSRAMEILLATGNSETIDFQVLGGLCAYHLQRAEMATVHALAERLIRQSERQQFRQGVVVAHVCLAVATFFRGQFEDARSHSARVLSEYDADEALEIGFLYGQDPGVIADNVFSFAAWIEGDTATALARNRRALDHAETLDNPFSLSLARAWSSRLNFEAGDYASALADANEAIRISQRKGYSFAHDTAQMIAGAALIELGEPNADIEQVRAGLRSWGDGGNELSRSYYQALLAQCERSVGNNERANVALDAAFAVVDKHGEAFWLAQLQRLRGEWRAADDVAGAQADLDASLASAQRLGAHALALRSAMSLLEFERTSGRDVAAASRLRAVCDELAADTRDPLVVAARETLAGLEQAGDG